MSLSTILSKITGRGVLTTGAVGAAASSYLLGINPFISITALMSAVMVLTFSKDAQAMVTKLLNGFADVPEWPRFVLLGIASLVAAYSGGGRSLLVLAFLLTAMDGNVFDALY